MVDGEKSNDVRLYKIVIQSDKTPMAKEAFGLITSQLFCVAV